MAREVRIYIAFLLPITCARPSVPYIRCLSLLLPSLVRVFSILNFKSRLILFNSRLLFLIRIFHRFRQYISTIIQIYTPIYTRLVPYFTYPCQICSIGQLYAFASRSHAYTCIDCENCRVFAIENAAYHLRFVTFIPSSWHLSTFTSIFFSFFSFFCLYIFYIFVLSLYIRIFSIIIFPTILHLFFWAFDLTAYADQRTSPFRLCFFPV